VGFRATKVVPGVGPPSAGPNPVVRGNHSAPTTGAARFNDRSDLASGATERGLTGTVENHHFAPDSYAERSVLGTLDAVRSVLSNSLRRLDMGGARTGTPTRPEPGTPRWNAWTGIEFVRTIAPMRLQVAVGRVVTGGGVDRVRFRLYGVPTQLDADRNGIPDQPMFELWLGEEGLQCATTGLIEGESCDPQAYRVANAGRILADATNINGLGASFLEYTVLPAELPARPSSIAQTSRIYLTQKTEGRRASVGGITVAAGTLTGTYSRVSYVPAGAAATATATDAIEPSATSCDRPRLCCDGLPCDLRLPLENEITEAREGRDDIESSFDHYLRVAREAAQTADALGQEYIQAGLEMDLRAEAARDQLEDLCGGVVNVESLGPRPCSVDADCCLAPPCNPVPSCNANGFCQYASGLAELQQESPDHASIANCLGADANVAVSLGDRALCYYQRTDLSLPPCDCGGGSCPECPIFEPEEGCSVAAFPGLGAAFSAQPTIPMFKSVADVDGFDPPECVDFARLRNGDEGAVDDILAQEWLNQAAVWAMGETIGTDPGLFNRMAITRAGATWLSTGSEADGPVETETFPCGPHSSLGPMDVLEFCGDGSTEFHGGRPFICGIDTGNFEDPDGCSDRVARTRHNQRLFQAAAVLAALGGSSGRYLRRPGFRNGEADDDDYEVFIHDYVDPFSRMQNGMLQGTDCDDPPGYPAMCWIREAMSLTDGYNEMGDLIFPRFCMNGTHNSGCESVMPDVTDDHILPSIDVPDWFASQYGDGFVHSFIDFHGDHGSSAHSAPVSETNARCVMLTDNTPDNETFMAAGAICPTYFTSVPAGFDELGADGLSRTPAMELVGFWSKFDNFNVDGNDVPTLRDLLEGIADESLVEHAVNTVVLDEFPGGMVNNGQLLDALELGCISALENGGGCSADLSELPELNSVSDFRTLRRMLECVAARIEFQLELMALFNVPATVAADLEDGQSTGTYPAYRGQYGQTVAELRAAIETINVVTRQVTSALRDFGGATEVAQAQLEVQDLESELAVNQAAATTSAQLARCASSQLNAGADPLKHAAAAVECADAAVQIGLAWNAANIMQNIDDLEKQQIFLQLSQTFGQQMDSLAGAASSLAQAYAELNGLLAVLDAQRNSASRQMALVLGLDTDAMGREYNVNHVMRARLNTLRIRYESAREKAIRLAWIAKIALEQKLGVTLEDLQAPMTLVDPPAIWAGRICSMPAIDYNAIRDVTDPEGPRVNYADAFIGDYVDMLESVKESYPFDFPFSDGDDTTIISLRDGVAGSRILCNAAGPNLLYHAADGATIAPAGEGGWIPECDEDGFCLVATQLDGSPFSTVAIENEDGNFEEALSRALGGAAVQRLQIVDSPEPPVDPVALTPRWTQALPLAAGTYLFSWHERLATPPMAMTECGPFIPPVNTRLVPSASGELGELDVSVHASGPYLGPATEPWQHSCWRRAWVIIENPTDQMVRVGLSIRQAPVMAPWPFVDFSAPQLEAVSDGADLMSITPLPFFPTDDELVWPVALCEDVYGDVFRAESWSSGCVDLCPDGFDESCGAAATTHCYHEMQFSIDLSEIEAGNLLSPGTFALGNYNYRTIDLAVNLVGVGVRDCELTDRRSECHASGFIPFSLRHDGPYTVRNHSGDEYDAPLFIGEIEHARALSSERYLSNPISSADQSLLSSYWRNEFAGRPMSGHYTLRIWDTPGFVWDRVRDVQLAVKYRYWTRFR
jgi:hypothetical protein